MTSSILASFYERDLRKLIEEISLFQSEENLWRTEGSIKNSSGNLALHITGGLNYLIGAQLGNTGYVRNRELEFTQKPVARKDLVAGLGQLIAMIRGTLNGMTPERMEAEFPMVFDGEKRSNTYLLIQLLAHLNYHLGQVNYLRRMLE